MTEAASSAVAQLPDELRHVVWEHAVDLEAFFGKPVVQLSREQIALWLGLRAEFGQRVADESLLDGNGKPWGRTPKPRVQDPQNWAPEFDSGGKLAGYIRVKCNGDQWGGRGGEKIIADAAAPLKPLDLREQVRELLATHPLDEVLLEIGRELDAYADKIVAQDNAKAVAASRDACAIRKSFAKLSWASQKPRSCKPGA